MENFIQPWIEDWGKKVSEHATTDFYKGIGYLTVSCLEDIYALLSDTKYYN
jgi:TorA maturation chaperone TorD